MTAPEKALRSQGMGVPERAHMGPNGRTPDKREDRNP